MVQRSRRKMDTMDADIAKKLNFCAIAVETGERLARTHGAMSEPNKDGFRMLATLFEQSADLANRMKHTHPHLRHGAQFMLSIGLTALMEPMALLGALATLHSVAASPSVEACKKQIEERLASPYDLFFEPSEDTPIQDLAVFALGQIESNGACRRPTETITSEPMTTTREMMRRLREANSEHSSS